MYRSVLFAFALSLIGVPSAVEAESVEALETELIEVGESAELLFRLASAYADLGNRETTTLYLDYLAERYPEFVQRESQAIESLRDMLAKPAGRSQTSDVVGLYQVSAGVDSNATQGTALSQLDLVLANGETLVLAVDPDSREIESSFLGGKIAVMYPYAEEIAVRGVAEYVEYQDSNVASMSLASLELVTPHHILSAYAFRRYGTRTGFAYQGQVQNLIWGGQSDQQQERVYVGLQGGGTLSEAVSGYWSGQVFRGDSVSQGAYRGNRWVAGLEMARFGIEYVFETARFDELFDPIFFPTVRDEYSWHRVDLAVPVVVTSDRRFDVIVSYNDKQHEVSLNRWRGLDVKLVLSAPLQ